MLYLFYIFSTVSSEICRSLVLSGGGSHGAFEAGALSGLVYNMPIADVEYNAVVGISAGAINSLGIALFPKGHETDAAKLLTKTWRMIDNSKYVFQSWKWGILSGLFHQSGLFDTAPERATLTDLVNGQELQRNISVGSTNANTGGYHVFDESLGSQGLIDAVMCSSAIPVAFPMQHFQNTYWMDGAVTYHMDVTTGVQKCLEVTEEKNIVIDMISCSYENLINADLDYNTKRVLTRVSEITAFNKLIQHLDWAVEAYPDVNFRYYIRPSSPLPGELGLKFDEESLEISIKQGYDDARVAMDIVTGTRERIKNMKQTPIVFP